MSSIPSDTNFCFACSDFVSYSEIISDKTLPLTPFKSNVIISSIDIKIWVFIPRNTSLYAVFKSVGENAAFAQSPCVCMAPSISICAWLYAASIISWLRCPESPLTKELICPVFVLKYAAFSSTSFPLLIAILLTFPQYWTKRLNSVSCFFISSVVSANPSFIWSVAFVSCCSISLYSSPSLSTEETISCVEDTMLSSSLMILSALSSSMTLVIPYNTDLVPSLKKSPINLPICLNLSLLLETASSKVSVIVLLIFLLSNSKPISEKRLFSWDLSPLLPTHWNCSYADCSSFTTLE